MQSGSRANNIEKTAKMPCNVKLNRGDNIPHTGQMEGSKFVHCSAAQRTSHGRQNLNEGNITQQASFGK